MSHAFLTRFCPTCKKSRRPHWIRGELYCRKCRTHWKPKKREVVSE